MADNTKDIPDNANSTDITENKEKNESRNYTHEQIIQLIQEFCLFDVEYMRIFFRNQPEAVQLVLRIIMDKPDLQVLEVNVEHVLPNVKRRSAIIDIFAKDSADTYYNIELQRSDDGAHIRRARYHGSIMDTGVTPTGTDWPDIPEVYIIFITENDVWGAGLPLYHIERHIRETGQLTDDGLHIIYANGAYRGNDDMGRLMEDFSQPDPDRINYSVLADRAKYLKMYEKGVKDMSILREWALSQISAEDKNGWFTEMTEAAKKAGLEAGEKIGHQTGLAAGEKIGRMAGHKDGLKAGEKIGAEKTASRLLKLGKLSNEEIAEASGLTIEEINEMSRHN